MTEARDLADRFHERWLHANPFAATMYGIPGYDDLLPDDSAAGQQAWRAGARRFPREAREMGGGQLPPAEPAPPAGPPHAPPRAAGRGHPGRAGDPPAPRQHPGP